MLRTKLIGVLSRLFVGTALLLNLSSCRTTGNDSSQEKAFPSPNESATMTETQWIAACQQELNQPTASGKDRARGELFSLAQTYDCKIAYPRVHKIYVDFMATIKK